MAAASQRCAVCEDAGRDRSRICVVEQPADVLAIERSGEFDGLYHVLHGALSPMNGLGPAQLRIDPLLTRLDGVAEVAVFGIPHDTWGETVAAAGFETSSSPESCKTCKISSTSTGSLVGKTPSESPTS